MRFKFLNIFSLKKANRKRLLIEILIIDLLLMVLLIWVLRVPFSNKYLLVSPKSYSALAMDPQKRYLVNQGDFIQGKAIPNTEVKVLLTPGKAKESVKVDDQGNFFVQIPANLDPKVYRLTLANFDESQSLAFAKGYRIRVQTNNKILQNKFLNNLLSYVLIKKAEALDGTPGSDYDWERLIGPDWIDWIRVWNKNGVCPAIDDNGEIIYLSKSGYDEIYGPTYICTIHEDIEGWQNEFEADKYFFVDLWLHLSGAGYSEESFIDYFPGWKEYIAQNRPSNAIVTRPIGIERKDSIDEETLIQNMNEVAIQRGYQEKSSLIRLFLNTSEPILQMRGLYNISTGYKFTNGWDYFDAVTALASLIPAKAVSAGTYKAALSSFEVREALDAVSDAKRLIQEGVVVTQQQFIYMATGRGKSWYYHQSLPKANFSMTHKLGVDEVVEPYDYYAREQFLSLIKPALERGQAHTMAIEDTLHPASENILNALRRIENQWGRFFEFNRVAFDDIVNSGHAYVLDDYLFKTVDDKAAGYAYGDLIVFKRSSYDNGDFSVLGLHHELIHTARGPRNMTGFIYKGDTERDIVLSAIYELSTNHLARKAMTEGTGGRVDFTHVMTGYEGEFPRYYENFLRFIELNPQYEFDFIQFALDGDADRFVRNVFGEHRLSNPIADAIFRRQPNAVPNYAQLLYYFENYWGINLAAVTFVGSHADENSIFFFPSFEVNDDAFTEGSIDPETSSEFRISLTEIQIEGDTIIVDTVASEDGNLIDSPRVAIAIVPIETFEYLKDESDVLGISIGDSFQEVDALIKEENCLDVCQITVSEIPIEGYQVEVYLLDDSGNIIASDSYPLDQIAPQASQIPEEDPEDTTQFEESIPDEGMFLEEQSDTQESPELLCDDIYYFDNNTQECIHKYATDDSCTYIFDPVDGSAGQCPSL